MNIKITKCVGHNYMPLIPVKIKAVCHKIHISEISSCYVNFLINSEFNLRFYPVVFLSRSVVLEPIEDCFTQCLMKCFDNLYTYSAAANVWPRHL